METEIMVGNSGEKIKVEVLQLILPPTNPDVCKKDRTLTQGWIEFIDLTQSESNHTPTDWSKLRDCSVSIWGHNLLLTSNGQHYAKPIRNIAGRFTNWATLRLKNTSPPKETI